MQFRQIRIFVRPDAPPNTWVENVVGKVIAPERKSRSVEWFWFSRYAEDSSGSSGDCDLHRIPADYNHNHDPQGNGYWRSVRFRFAIGEPHRYSFERRIQRRIDNNSYAASGFLPYPYINDLAATRMIAPPRNRERLRTRARLMAKALHSMALIFIDCLQSNSSGDFFQEQVPDYSMGLGCSMEPLRHLLVNLTSAPTQVFVNRRAEGSLEPRPHPYGEPQVWIEEQTRVAFTAYDWLPPFM
jgi:hypothetical protein